MEPILDETTLVACPTRAAPTRVLELARTLLALDGVGAPRVLRSVRDAADRDLGGGRGLRGWCFDPATNRDAGRLLASRLANQPYVDGDGGLFVAAEGAYAVEATVDGIRVCGLGLAALTDGAAVTLASAATPMGRDVVVALVYLDEDGARSESVAVPSFARAIEVQERRKVLQEKIERSVPNGHALFRRIGELFPRLRLGARACKQIEDMRGNEPVFPQLLRHLRTLDLAASEWQPGANFALGGLSFSVESTATLSDGRLGPMRDFPVPSGFAQERWSLHTKLTGGNGARLYFRAVRDGGEGVVLVGYFGDHLPTVKNRT